MRKLTYLESKLLKKTDFFRYRQEDTTRENAVIGSFKLKNHEEYRQYLKMASCVKQLSRSLAQLPDDNELKITISRELRNKLYRMGVLESVNCSLEDCSQITVPMFCRRRLPILITKLKYAQHRTQAVDLVEHGHISIGADVVTDPATLVTRDMEDKIRWSEGSKMKRITKEFRGELDDADMMNI
eukprot:Protomagalhaensia_sp_Gyna_25__3666@NODE_3295_length_635_cov_28_187919_g2763_i0_p1_GENE_NODE_3295_length_635_cov_28_187919_g2763_i0NODE_3295_length_635_cov_28_187919_g2763_i0_p1_ORF_typecomplete_len193_score28_18Ribosomal_S4/PF00163_19/2_1e09S4/PF01479_25/2_7e03S4/PF01479_25/4_2e06_NODE_3295_length_635_cov_28_187919_g2763_i057611